MYVQLINICNVLGIEPNSQELIHTLSINNFSGFFDAS